MPKDPTLRLKRDQRLRERYEWYSEHKPQWRHGAILAAIAEELFISPRTASAIFNGEGVYGN
ncbi:hypothetical protein GGR32_000149 [Mesonia hippocampi]|uniref:Uncharacterized protein n=1 Tax=Mesonia hippocampi TaxID=1628250 RepID=A0A840ESG1_9FLAO|nr:hypothetical protein [Mesonia hippocampi]MBB4117877.1 hypothetical protein [Mesonia hippocampi]